MTSPQFDVFISHASEDKDDVARPLADQLKHMGLKVWLDEFELRLGDSLNRKINNGLAESKFGIVILSGAFFSKEWPQKELDGLVARDDGKAKVILPIWHNVKKEEVTNYSPILADKLAVLTEHGILYVAEQIQQAIEWEKKDSDLKETNSSTTSSIADATSHPSKLATVNEITSEDRSAMRAYLQRAEVRLSTMHRIAGAFLNGAGLLLLFPVFFRETIKEIIGFFISNIRAEWLMLIAYCALFVPFLLSLSIPIYALYLLLKDTIHFYFTGHNPGFPDRLFNPRFALSGIAFSTDESEIVKHDIYRKQYSSNLINFILPFDEEEAGYFDEVKKQTDSLITPESRHDQLLASFHLFDYPNVKPHQQDIDRFNTALGLAGVLDRPLLDEVAKMETSLARHALCLRRLVLRYIKALSCVPHVSC